MNVPATIRRSAAAALLVLGACTPSPPPSGMTDGGALLPEPVRAVAPRVRPAPTTGLAGALAEGTTEVFALDAGRMEITHPHGTAGEATVDTAATAEQLRAVLAGLRFRAVDGALLIEGEAPFAGRVRRQARGDVLRLSRIATRTGGPADCTLTAEVHGDDMVGRVVHRSSPGQVPEWSRAAFFRAPLHSVDSPEGAPRP